MMDQHFREHLCELEVCNEVLVLQPGSGIPQGSSTATRLSIVFIPSLYGHLIHIREVPTMFWLLCPLSLCNSINTSLTSFVDDVASILASNDHRTLLQMMKNSNAKLDECLSLGSMVQNISNQEFICRFFGNGATKSIKHAQKLEGFRQSARYLGPHLRWDCGTSMKSLGESKLQTKHISY